MACLSYGPDEDPLTPQPEIALRMAAPQLMTTLFDLVVEAGEEAIVNALVAARTITGRHGVTAHQLPHELLRHAVQGVAGR